MHSIHQNLYLYIFTMSFYKNCYRSLIRLSLKKFKKYDYKEYIKYKNEILMSNKIYYDNKSTDIIYEWNVITPTGI
jgi:hypothetical protein